MKVISSLLPKESLQAACMEKFPDDTFVFAKGIENLESHVEDAEVFITYADDVTEDWIDRAKSLRWIMVMSAGLDRIPFDLIEKRGILVTNVRGIHAKPMAEYALMYFLDHIKNRAFFEQQQKNQVWDRTVKPTECCDQTLCVVGAGAIGSELARLAKLLGVRTVGVNTSGQMRPHFDEMYAISGLTTAVQNADFVASVLPSTNDTKHVFDDSVWGVMKETAGFLNMGRGSAVEEDSLLNALRESKLAHAYLDVFETEPLPEDHPFWTEQTITITPHISGTSKHYLPRAFEIFSRNMELIKEQGWSVSQLQNVIDGQRGY